MCVSNYMPQHMQQPGALIVYRFIEYAVYGRCIVNKYCICKIVIHQIHILMELAFAIADLYK